KPVSTLMPKGWPLRGRVSRSCKEFAKLLLLLRIINPNIRETANESEIGKEPGNAPQPRHTKPHCRADPAPLRGNAAACAGCRLAVAQQRRNYRGHADHQPGHRPMGSAEGLAGGWRATLGIGRARSG